MPGWRRQGARKLPHTRIKRGLSRLVHFTLAAALASATIRASLQLFISNSSRSAASPSGVENHGPRVHRARRLLPLLAERVPAEGGAGDSSKPLAAQADGPVDAVVKWWNDTVAYWEALELFLPLDEDPSDEAVALVTQEQLIDQMREEQEAVVAKKSYMRVKADNELGAELGKMPGLVLSYWTMRITRILSKEKVREGFVSFLTYGNIIFIVLFLRTVVPRLLVVSSLDDLFAVANDVGMPSQNNLRAAIEYLQALDFGTKVALYTAAFVVEKLTLISEILPVQVGLKTISPLLFGGLVPGALISATCETVGAAVNFLVGRSLFTQKLKELSIFGGEPLGEAAWFGRLESAAERDGFQLSLLLRLAHILPLPFDSYWYILGALPVALPAFVAAHWVGCLKTAFLDASLGEVLLTSVGVEGGPKQSFVVAETIAFTVVAILVQTTATGLAKDLLGLEEKDGGDDASDETAESAKQSDGKESLSDTTDRMKVDESSDGSSNSSSRSSTSSTAKDSTSEPRQVVAE